MAEIVFQYGDNLRKQYSTSPFTDAVPERQGSRGSELSSLNNAISFLQVCFRDHQQHRPTHHHVAFRQSWRLAARLYWRIRWRTVWNSNRRIRRYWIKLVWQPGRKHFECAIWYDTGTKLWRLRRRAFQWIGRSKASYNHDILTVRWRRIDFAAANTNATQQPWAVQQHGVAINVQQRATNERIRSIVSLRRYLEPAATPTTAAATTGHVTGPGKRWHRSLSPLR